MVVVLSVTKVDSSSWMRSCVLFGWDEYQSPCFYHQILLLGSVLAICLGQYTGQDQQPKKGYFQYVNVPGHKEYEFGFRRGNKDHYISRFEQGKDHRFKTIVKWADKHDGHGEHYFEYNHAPKHQQKHKKFVEYHTEVHDYKPAVHEYKPAVHEYKPEIHEYKPEIHEYKPEIHHQSSHDFHDTTYHR